MEINRWNFFLNSTFSSNGDTDSPTYQLYNPLTLSRDDSYFEAQIINICIPFSFKMINNTNNTLTGIKINGSGDYTLVLPNGNYNIIDFMALFATQMNIVLARAGSSAQLSLTFNDDQGLVDISSNSFDIVYIPFSNNVYIGKMLGFFNTDVFISFSNSPQTSPDHFNVSPIQQILIRSTRLLTKNYEFVVEYQQNPSDVIGSCNILTSFDSYINFSSIIPIVSKLSVDKIDYIDFYLQDDLSYVNIDLGGINWFCNLLIVEKVPLTLPQSTRHIPRNLLQSDQQPIASEATQEEPPEQITGEPPSEEPVEQPEEEVLQQSEADLARYTQMLKNLEIAQQDLQNYKNK